MKQRCLCLLVIMGCLLTGCSGPESMESNPTSHSPGSSGEQVPAGTETQSQPPGIVQMCRSLDETTCLLIYHLYPSDTQSEWDTVALYDMESGQVQPLLEGEDIWIGNHDQIETTAGQAVYQNGNRQWSLTQNEGEWGITDTKEIVPLEGMARISADLQVQAVSIGDQEGIAVQDAGSGEELARLESAPGTAMIFVWKPDGEEIALLNRDRSAVTLWNWQDDIQRQISAEELDAPSDWVEIGEIGYSGDGHSLWVHWYQEIGSAVTIWDLAEERVRHTWSIDETLLCFDTCENYLLCGTEKSGRLMLYDCQSGEMETLKESDGFYTAACFVGGESVLANLYQSQEEENMQEVLILP